LDTQIPKEWIVIKTIPYKGYKNESGLSKHLGCSGQALSSLIGLVTTKTARYRLLPLGILTSETIMQSQSAACDARHSWEGTCSCALNTLLGTIAKGTRLEVRIVPQEDKPIDPLRSLAGGDSGDAVSWTCHARGQRDQQISKTRNLEIWHCNTCKLLCDDPIITLSRRLNPGTASMAWVPKSPSSGASDKRPPVTNDPWFCELTF
jgi:hypothetical protein